MTEAALVKFGENVRTLQPVQPGEYGVAVYTTLWDKGFPLLRYWTDDYIAVDTTPCRCGRPLPRIRYQGRMADSLEINGTYVFPKMLEEILFKHGFIGEYRAAQKGGKKSKKNEETKEEIPAAKAEEPKVVEAPAEKEEKPSFDPEIK